MHLAAGKCSCRGLWNFEMRTFGNLLTICFKKWYTVLPKSWRGLTAGSNPKWYAYQCDGTSHQARANPMLVLWLAGMPSTGGCRFTIFEERSCLCRCMANIIGGIADEFQEFWRPAVVLHFSPWGGWDWLPCPAQKDSQERGHVGAKRLSTTMACSSLGLYIESYRSELNQREW